MDIDESHLREIERLLNKPPEEHPYGRRGWEIDVRSDGLLLVEQCRRFIRKGGKELRESPIQEVET